MALIDDLQLFYDTLVENSVENKFRGKATELYQSIPGFKMSNYTRHRRALLACECIKINAQGSRYAKSDWDLLQRPTQGLIETADPDILTPRANESTQRSILSSQVRAIQRSLGGVNVIEAMREIEQRLTALEEVVGIPDNIKENEE